MLLLDQKSFGKREDFLKSHLAYKNLTVLTARHARFFIMDSNDKRNVRKA